MKRFAQLIEHLDQTNSSKQKVALLCEYFTEADAADGIWACALFVGKKIKRPVKTSQLRDWTAELAGIPLWLMEECYDVVGDLAETTAKLIPHNKNVSSKPLHQWMELLKSLPLLHDDEKKTIITQTWVQMDAQTRFVFNKLITGGFRTGVSTKLLAQALAKYAGKEVTEITYALTGSWLPEDTSLNKLLLTTKETDSSKPYPLCLAHALQAEDVPKLDLQHYFIEWKFDGIRAQIIKRNDTVYIWSRGEEIITHHFPEIQTMASNWPNGTVVDGEIVAWNSTEQKVDSFAKLQKRINTKKPSAKLCNSIPTHFIAYDLLEIKGLQLIQNPLHERKNQLQAFYHSINKHTSFSISSLLNADSSDSLIKLRAEARDCQTEGLMLKLKDSAYHFGRKTGIWWKWKLDPLSFDAVLTYAQKGHGIRANLFSDFTFGIWKDEQLITITKAYTGLTNKELSEINKFINKHTIERFGPVRSIEPTLVFEIGFDSLQVSPRHKAGIALRFPRILRWRKDKSPKDADTIEQIKKLLPAY